MNHSATDRAAIYIAWRRLFNQRTQRIPPINNEDLERKCVIILAKP